MKQTFYDPKLIGIGSCTFAFALTIVCLAISGKVETRTTLSNYNSAPARTFVRTPNQGAIALLGFLLMASGGATVWVGIKEIEIDDISDPLMPMPSTQRYEQTAIQSVETEIQDFTPPPMPSLDYEEDCEDEFWEGEKPQESTVTSPPHPQLSPGVEIPENFTAPLRKGGKEESSESPEMFVLNDLGKQTADSAYSLVAIGAPGTGKSTVMRWIFISAALSTKPNPENENSLLSVNIVAMKRDRWMGLEHTDCCSFCTEIEGNHIDMSPLFAKGQEFLREYNRRNQFDEQAHFAPNILLLDDLTAMKALCDNKTYREQWEAIEGISVAATTVGRGRNTRVYATMHECIVDEIPMCKGESGRSNMYFLCFGYQYEDPKEGLVGSYDAIRKGLDLLVGRANSRLASQLKKELPTWIERSKKFNRPLILVVMGSNNAYFGLAPDLAWVKDFQLVQPNEPTNSEPEPEVEVMPEPEPEEKKRSEIDLFPPVMF